MKYSIPIITLVTVLQLVESWAEMIELTSDNFKQNFNCDRSNLQTQSYNLTHDWFIMFMAPWCGHCKQAKPQFQKFGTYIENGEIIEADQVTGEFKNIPLKAAFIDCSKDRELCGSFGVQGYPTFIYITKTRKGIKYTGPRKVDSFLNFTLFHDPEQKHEFSQYIKLSYSIWDDIIPGVKAYWWQILVFGVVLPSLVGYGLGQLIYGRKQGKVEKGGKEVPLLDVGSKDQEGKEKKQE